MGPVRWLLLRGLAREQRHWGGFRQKFSESVGAETLCLDLPGMGTESHRMSPSRVPEIVDDLRERWLQRRGDEPWGLFGMSLGAMVALDWSHRYPKDFERLAVVNASAAELSKLWERLIVRQWPRVLMLAAAQDSFARESAILRMTSRHHTHDKELASEWAAFSPPLKVFLEVASRQLAAATRFRLPPALGCPGLVLASEKDAFVNPRCSERIARRFGLPMVVHLDSGHDLCLDAPTWVGREVARWLRES